MDYSPEQYAVVRALCDKAEAYRTRIAGARNWISAEEASHLDYAAVDNAMRGRVEKFELMRDKPDRFTAYLGARDADGRHVITTWTGDIIGCGRVNSKGPRRGNGERQHYGQATACGRSYAFQGPGEGMYCRLRALKA